MERLLGFDAQLLFDSLVTAVNIFILFFALSYLLFNPVREMLERRRLKIENELKAAAQDKEDARAMRESYEGRIKGIKKEAELMMNDARKKAQGRELEIVEEAKEEAGRILMRGSREADLEKKRAMEEVKGQMVSIASAMAAKALSVRMDGELQDILIEDTLKEIGDSTWQS